MAPEPKKDAHEGGYSPHMKTVAWAILIMGLSLVVVIGLWIWFGYIGPSFSADVLQQQQTTLREKYGLPQEKTNSAELEVPPSLRSSEGATSIASSNATGGNQTAGDNATAPAGNVTAASPATNQTSGAPSGGTKVSIVQGASSKTNDAFDPNPVKAKVGHTVTWTNDDSTPHTVTSGSNGKPDGKFDSSPGLKSLLNPGQTFDYKFTKAGEYPYYCQLHPNMVGTVSVS
jgi:plastocyanin